MQTIFFCHKDTKSQSFFYKSNKLVIGRYFQPFERIEPIEHIEPFEQNLKNLPNLPNIFYPFFILLSHSAVMPINSAMYLAGTCFITGLHFSIKYS